MKLLLCFSFITCFSIKYLSAQSIETVIVINVGDNVFFNTDDKKPHTGKVIGKNDTLYIISYNKGNKEITLDKNRLFPITTANILKTLASAMEKEAAIIQQKKNNHTSSNNTSLPNPVVKTSNDSVSVPVQNIHTELEIKSQDTFQNTNSLDEIYSFGETNGWGNSVLKKLFEKYKRSISDDKKREILNILNKGKTNSAKFFGLKSYLALDTDSEVESLINELNLVPEFAQQDGCLANTHNSIIQQWENSCAATVVQTYLGDLCPRYMWALKKIKNFDVADPRPDENLLGQQQKMFMEKYLVSVTKRGDMSGKYIPINNVLNDYVGKILSVKFNTVKVTQPLTTELANIRSQIDIGYRVPILIGFIGTEAKHFMLMMNYRKSDTGYEYEIYDPWDGICDFVKESNMIQNIFSPLQSNWKISLEYYYLTQEM